MKRTIIDTAADHLIISILLVFAVGILIISALAGPPAAKSTAPKSLEEQQAADYARAANAEEKIKERRVALLVAGLRDSMRDPQSFTLAWMTYMPSGAICAEYRARNGFGGLNVEHALETPGGAVRAGDFADFAAEWNRSCTRERGEDISFYANELLKIAGMMDR